MTTAVGKNKPAKTPAKYLHIHAFQKQKVITRNKNDTKKKMQALLVQMHSLNYHRQMHLALNLAQANTTLM